MRNLLAVLAVVALVAAPSFGVVNITMKAKVGTGTFGSGPIALTAADVGKTVTVQLFAQDSAGVLAVGGDIVPTGAAGTFSAGSDFAWTVKSVSESISDGTTLKLPQANGSFAGALPDVTLNDDDFDGMTDNYAVAYSADATVNKQVAPVASTVSNTTNLLFNLSNTGAANGGQALLGSGQAPSGSPSATFGAAAPALLGTYTFTILAPGAVTLNWVNADKALGGNGGWFTTGVPSGDTTVNPTGLIFTPEPATMALLALGGLLVARRRQA